MNTNTSVIICLDVDGFHRYPNAPKAVSFLRKKHRHTFKIKVAVQVETLDREKEIFLLRDDLQDYINEAFGCPAQFNTMSCEMIAKEVLEFFEPENAIWCEVYEEETGGARVEIQK